MCLVPLDTGKWKILPADWILTGQRGCKNFYLQDKKGRWCFLLPTEIVFWGEMLVCFFPVSWVILLIRYMLASWNFNFSKILWFLLSPSYWKTYLYNKFSCHSILFLLKLVLPHYSFLLLLHFVLLIDCVFLGVHWVCLLLHWHFMRVFTAFFLVFCENHIQIANSYMIFLKKIVVFVS